jgi:uncharacterized membrane protein
LLHSIFPGEYWIWVAFCASLAAANADTWATEIGSFSKTKPRSITSWKIVEPGTSGGITLAGSLASIAGSSLIALLTWVFDRENFLIPVLIITAGSLGSVVDSVFGATLQSIYSCTKCGKTTEKHPIHGCGGSTIHIYGIPWINNDVVNAACTTSAAFLAASGMILFQ